MKSLRHTKQVQANIEIYSTYHTLPINRRNSVHMGKYQRQAEETTHLQKHQKQDEVSVVVEADTGHHPRAVVIHIVYALSRNTST